LTSTGTDDAADQSIMTTLLTLQSITLSGAVFSNPAYTTLVDFTTAIVPEPTGRPDPFAPFTVSAAPSSAVSTKGAQLFQPTKK
jgi:hypothetical protein